MANSNSSHGVAKWQLSLFKHSTFRRELGSQEWLQFGFHLGKISFTNLFINFELYLIGSICKILEFPRKSSWLALPLVGHTNLPMGLVGVDFPFTQMKRKSTDSWLEHAETNIITHIWVLRHIILIHKSHQPVKIQLDTLQTRAVTRHTWRGAAAGWGAAFSSHNFLPNTSFSCLMNC